MNEKTELVFIIDESGSMGGMEADTVGGFNAMLAKQKAEKGEAFVTTVFFSNRFKMIHDRLPLSETPALTLSDYVPSGCTALLDTIGETVSHIEQIHRYARPEDVPGNVLFFITTDGMENASRKYTYQAVKEMISKKKEECGWEFVFVASNIDAVAVAQSIGIASDRAATFSQTPEGYASMYDSCEMSVRSFRCAKMLNNDWKSNLK